MSYIIEKQVGNSIYLYEVRSFWDSEKKQPRQKRKYLGKKDPETGEPVRPRSSHRPRLSKDYGHIYLLEKIAGNIGLIRLVREVFPDDYNTMLALAFFEISEAAPLCLFPYWVESVVLENVRPLSPKELTAFTKKMGQMDCERLEFLRRWAGNTGQNEVIVFDITSLSSYSALSEYAEPGYNRDKEKLPQINLGVLCAENSNLPLYYHIRPGSIRDVSTLHNIVKFLKYFELKDILFVMDRGFYSKANLSDMKQSEVRFIIPMPRTVNLFSALVNGNTQKLSDLTDSFLFKDEVLFHTEESVRVNKISLHANLYLDPQSRSEQRVRFLKKILNLEESCNKLTFQNKKEVVQYLSSQLSGASQFFRITVRKGETVVFRKTETISERMANMGVTIILTDHNKIGRETILDLYRRKDYLEKTFDVLKNEFDGKRLRSSSKDTIEGRLFVKFLSLILYSAVGNIMRKQELFKRYSIREIMYELKKVRVIEMNNGKSYLTEISKRQREIFNKFDLEIPDI